MKGIFIFVIIALVVSVIIVVIDNLFKEEKNIEKEIIKLLPGYNCGGCGYINCSSMAKELIENKDAILKCRPLKNKNEVMERLNNILK